MGSTAPVRDAANRRSFVTNLYNQGLPRHTGAVDGVMFPHLSHLSIDRYQYVPVR
jgi:hypothetical protein